MISENPPASSSSDSLLGFKVLVPRGGQWGHEVAAAVRNAGGVPVIAPLINFAASEDPKQVANLLHELTDGQFSWFVVSSTTTVDVLISQRISLPESTKVAAVDELTAQSLRRAGFRVDALAEMAGEQAAESARNIFLGSGRVLISQADLVEPGLVLALTELGFSVEFINAYRTVPVPAPGDVISDIFSGQIGIVLTTSGSVARQLAEQFAPFPQETIVACLGERAAQDARKLGLPVQVFSPERNIESLLLKLGDYLGTLDAG